MLHGVGGRTVEEAQRRMSYQEYLNWIRYRNKHGTISAGLRVEKTLAYVALKFASAYLKKPGGAKFNLDDFLLFQHKQPDVEATPDDVLRLLRSVAVKD